MNAIRLWPLALFITLHAASIGLSDPINAFLFASYGIGGTASTSVNQGTPPPVQLFNQSDQQQFFSPFLSGGFATVSGNGVASSQHAESSATASAKARPGGLHVAFAGAYLADTIGPVNSFGAPAATGGASFFGGATARVSDSVTMTSNRVPIGAPIQFTGSFILDGQLGVTGIGNGDAYVQVQNNEMVPGSGDFRVDTSNGGETQVIAKNLPTSFVVENGHEFGLDVSISVGGSLSGGSGNDPGSSASGAAFADFSDTLRWGGISSVLSETGAPIDDWTITSVSGFDYSKPFVDVPEPTNVLLLGTAICALPTLRPKRSWRQCPPARDFRRAI